MIELLAAGVLLAVGMDAYVTHRRMKKYGPLVELNPLIRQVSEDAGIIAGVGAGIVVNLGITSLIYLFHATLLMAILLGAKLSLVACQLNSLRVETFIDKLLEAKFNAKTPSHRRESQ